MPILTPPSKQAKQTRAHESVPDFDNEANFPRFAEPIPNITVTIGRDALLACVVENLKGYKTASADDDDVGWI
ncbi:hypothetical protein pipiens_013239 [Culex pipiens pipiens]|uniref:Ig-like domain-containing protein n=1 Tax=Culex pipiens pipiens TaxID=38569 RepID=A0ABD1CZ99_CULPP